MRPYPDMLSVKYDKGCVTVCGPGYGLTCRHDGLDWQGSSPIEDQRGQREYQDGGEGRSSEQSSDVMW